MFDFIPTFNVRAEGIFYINKVATGGARFYTSFLTCLNMFLNGLDYIGENLFLYVFAWKKFEGNVECVTEEKYC